MPSHDTLHGLGLGPVGLAVRDLSRSLAFHTGALGLEAIEREPGRAVVGAGGRPLLELVERPGAASRDPAEAGLFHVALLQPDRAALGHALRRLLDSGARLTGAADHVVSEAVYLDDPDGHGIEIYADRPRETWLQGGVLRLDNLPLDADGILAAADRDPGASTRTAEAVIGHIHLETHDLPAARAFYLDRLGLDLTVDAGRALFMAADGYHHHLAANTWGRRTRPLRDDPGRVGLLYYTLTLPDPTGLAAVLGAEPLAPAIHATRDPSGIEVRLASS